MRAERQKLDYTLYEQVRASLDEFAGQLGFWPRFVFDRGFMSIGLVRLFARHKAVFYVRLKAGQFLELSGKSLKVRWLENSDTRVKVAGIPLRVIRSEQPADGYEPWYILTSDMRSKRRKIIDIYYHLKCLLADKS